MKLPHVVGFILDEVQELISRFCFDKTKYGIDTKICLETKSTGTISAIRAEFPGKSFRTPSPTSKLAP